MNRKGSSITDDKGRTLILRGVNLGGSSKVPPNRPRGPETLKNPATVSFVGRPFPLEEAEEQFGRLAAWGFTFIRFIITWEAIEHSGPGIYDEAYLDYLEKILLAAEKKGISLLMDPHQDAWSRWTGGDGAPAWTLEMLGMDLDKLGPAGAAIISENRKGNEKPGKSAPMIWPVNYSHYAAATMFTLFFGGNTFAPQVKVEWVGARDGVRQSAQDFLQERYIEAFCHCYRRLKNCKAIRAWGIMNEPHPGFIGCRNLWGVENAALATGPVPGPFHAMVAASGHSVSVPVYIPWINGWKKIGRKTINPQGISIFKEGFSCPWEQAGVWANEGEGGRLIAPDHFVKQNGRPIKFTDDFLKPFNIRFMERMSREAQHRDARHPETTKPVLFFIEGVPNGESPSWGKDDPSNAVNAFHHYDGLTLFSKNYNPHFTGDNKAGKIILGKKKTAAHYSSKLAEAKKWAKDNMNDMPCFLGEFGLPFDLKNKKAYKTGDYRVHEEALTIYYNGIDENLLGSTIWDYTSDNTHEEGDRWNGEDLSIVSTGPASGGMHLAQSRAEGGWLRPYPMATAGVPLKFTWDRKRKVFCYLYRAEAAIEAPTEIFLPSKYFAPNPDITVMCNSTEGQKTAASAIRTEYIREEQRLFVYNDGYGGEVEIRVQ